MKKRPTKEQFQLQLTQIAKELRAEIMAGVFAPGDYLPSEKALEARFGLSNHSIRLGLEQLVKEGWIKKVSSVGNQVVADRLPVRLTLSCDAVTVRNLHLAGLLNDFHDHYP